MDNKEDKEDKDDKNDNKDYEDNNDEEDNEEFFLQIFKNDPIYQLAKFGEASSLGTDCYYIRTIGEFKDGRTQFANKKFRDPILI